MKKEIEELKKLCIEIFAFAELDSEITINGNGTNPCEASTVAEEVLRILKIKIPKKDINKRVKELKIEHCYEE